ncbi:MAG: MFS transporter, partial [Pseudomonadota bacterium]
MTNNPSDTIPHEKLIIITIGLTMLMEFIDISVLNTSLPQIAFSLQVNPVNLKAALTVYLLALGMFIPAASWLAQRFG